MVHLDIDQLARLARLDVTPDEADRLADQLGRMLDAFALVDVADPGDGAPPVGDLRPDVPAPTDDDRAARLRAAFPARKGDLLDVGGLR